MTTSAFRLAEFDDERLGVELLHPPAMFYALVHNHVPVVHHLRMRNDGGNDLRDVEVRMELVGPDGTLAGPWTRQMPVIPAFGAVGWDEFGDFSPATAALVHVDEATRLGRAHLRGPAALCGMVDIRLAHRTGIQPLPPPIRGRHGRPWNKPNPWPPPSSCCRPSWKRAEHWSRRRTSRSRPPTTARPRGSPRGAVRCSTSACATRS